jgi:hypothetical protein
MAQKHENKPGKPELEQAHKLPKETKPEGWRQKLEWELLRAEADALVRGAK